MAERLTDSLWSSIEDIYRSILDHPFITGLTDGGLSHDVFLHFIAQDAHYLRGFARALTVCASKAPTENDTVMFAQHAAGAISAEQEMHAELAGRLGLSAEQLASRPIGPTTQAYGSYLLATAHNGSFAEGLAAVLPCYWIYGRVGDALAERSSPDPLYARWIAMYGGEDFQSTVDEVLALTDRVGAELSSAETARVRGHFVTTSRYEWMFWDAGYRQEAWPI